MASAGFRLCDEVRGRLNMSFPLRPLADALPYLDPMRCVQ
jgi:hypothetical protein